MAMINVWLNMEEKGIVHALREAAEKLAGAEDELIVDFAAVRRIDQNVLRAIEGLAGIADQKSLKVMLRGVNVDVYKVLKLVKLAPRFTFVNSDGDGRATNREGSHAESPTR
ncbi:MAG TPA: STAS domain-containing protein [Candidatus Sulfotelmatobacter sp.]|nr:STAS domain-containing protein [Candidatus Sulfotelmatobacter sp.]